MDVVVDQLLFTRDRRCVLDIPSLTFPSGSTTALFGPNGSGKTTLIRLIAGLEHPTGGTISVGGTAVAVGRVGVPRVGLAFQEPVFLRGSVRRNLDLALRLRRLPAAERTARIEQAAHECGVAHVLDRSARQLSGGEAQRANLARVLALRAPITLLDEPLAGIDRIARTQLLYDLPRLLATFAATTILVTHDREEAFRLADRLVVMIGGMARTAGAKADVYSHPPDRETAELLGYTALPTDAGMVAVPPGGLKLGTGELTFTLVVESVVDMGNHLHVLGAVAGARADVRLPADAPWPMPGVQLTVRAASHVRL